MSIIAAAAAPTTEPTTSVATWAALVASTILATVIAVALRVFRPRTVAGPERVPAAAPLWPLVVSMIGMVVAYFFVSIAYGVYLAIQAKQRGAGAPELSSADYILLSLSGPIVGLLAGWVLDASLQPDLIRWLGAGVRRIPQGVAKGLASAVIVLPWMFTLGVLLDLLYKAIRYQHPNEHDLLRFIHDVKGRPALWWAGIAAAVLVAPLVEEYLFRGHFQTWLKEALVRRSQPHTPPPFSVVVPGDPTLPFAQLGPVNPDNAPASRSTVWQSWAAIVLTSLLFAIVHPLWSVPLIFPLSIAFGYAYERTGNLWTTITLHALFNLTNTLVFLWQ